MGRVRVWRLILKKIANTDFFRIAQHRSFRIFRVQKKATAGITPTVARCFD